MTRKSFILIWPLLFASACSSQQNSFSGFYMTAAENDGQYTQSLTIAKADNDDYVVSFSASRVKEKFNCRLYGSGAIVEDRLEIEISDWRTPTVMTITPSDEGGMDVYTKNHDNRFALNYFCGGGASLAGIYHKQKSSPPPASFLITGNNVGLIDYRMTINELLDSTPTNRIKKEIAPGEFSEDHYDDYIISDSNNDPQLVVTPVGGDASRQPISSVRVLDPRFRTIMNIGVGSSFAALRDSHSITEVAPDGDHIVVAVNELNAWFRTHKDELNPNWRNEDKKAVELEAIPGDAPISDIIIWLNDKSAE